MAHELMVRKVHHLRMHNFQQHIKKGRSTLELVLVVNKLIDSHPELLRSYKLRCDRRFETCVHLVLDM